MVQRLLLVADDDEDNRVILSTVLTHFGYGVFLASNGLEAVEQVQRHAPDLILMDLQMPVMDGWEAVRLLKADPATASIPIAAITAQDFPVSRFKEAGFCAYIRKPIRLPDVIPIVKMCLDETARQKLWIDVPIIDITPPLLEP